MLKNNLKKSSRLRFLESVVVVHDVQIIYNKYNI